MPEDPNIASPGESFITGIHALIMFAQDHTAEFKTWLDTTANDVGTMPPGAPEVLTLKDCADMLADIHDFIDTLDMFSSAQAHAITVPGASQN